MKTRKKILLTGSLIIIIVSGFFLWKHFNSSSNKAGTNTEEINYSPPTKEESSSGDEQKDQIEKRKNELKKDDSSSGSTSQNTNSNTLVVIADASQYGDTIEIRAFIPNHYQDGTCSFTLTNGSRRIQKTTPATRDASTTICANPLIKRSDIPAPGDWQLIVGYMSKDAQGVSEPRFVEVK